MLDLREAFNMAVATGIPAARIAKHIGRDSATLYKWADGTRNISKEIEEEVRNELKYIKEQWSKIEIGE